jgi:hypothetical protein
VVRRAEGVNGWKREDVRMVVVVVYWAWNELGVIGVGRLRDGV